MNSLLPNTSVRLAFAIGALVGLGACAKKEPKPLRTEPWLAHPPASAATTVDGGAAPAPTLRYTLTQDSRIRFEIPGAPGSLRGALTRASGEIRIVPSDLSQSRGQVRVDLDSLSFEGPGADDATARALSALDLSDAGPTSTASFDLSELRDLTPAELEPAPPSASGALLTRHVRATAVGNLLLHGFRVVRRAPVEAEFGFSDNRSAPSTLLIRSRAPFVVSLETHAIRVLRPEDSRKPAKPGAAVADIRVTIELYATKSQ